MPIVSLGSLGGPGSGTFVRGDVKKLRRRMTELEKKVLPAALVTTLNNRARAATSKARKRSAAALGLKPKVMKSRIRFPKTLQATRRKMYATVIVSKAEINAASLLGPKRAEALIARTHGPIPRRPKTIKTGTRHQYAGAFVGRGRGNNILIFKRITEAASPLAAMKIKHFAKSRAEVQRELHSRLGFHRELRRQLKRRLKR